MDELYREDEVCKHNFRLTFLGEGGWSSDPPKYLKREVLELYPALRQHLPKNTCELENSNSRDHPCIEDEMNNT